MRFSSAIRLIAWAGVIAAAIAIQALWGAPHGHMLWSAVFDAGHVPLFGVVSLAVLKGLLVLTGPRGSASSAARANRTPVPTRWPRPMIYLAALIATTGIGGITEASQYFGARDADPVDFAHNVYGALAFLAAAYALDPHAKRSLWGGRIPGRLTRTVLLLGTGSLLLTTIVPVARVANDYLQRNRAFPSICEFEDAWEHRFVGPRDAELRRVPPPEGWRGAQRLLEDRSGAASSGDEMPKGKGPRGSGPREVARADRADGRESERVGQLTFHVAVYPALHIMEPHPDWSGYDRLVFEIYSEFDHPRELSFRINDNQHDNTYADRFNRVLTVMPGPNHYEIELEDVARGPRHRRLDLRHVRNASLFAVRPEAPFRIWVDGFRLERD